MERDFRTIHRKNVYELCPRSQCGTREKVSCACVSAAGLGIVGLETIPSFPGDESQDSPENIIFLSWLIPRAMRDLTVPRGTWRMSAMSL